MSADITPEVRQQRIKEFLQILPLTMELAGLPKCAPDRLFTPDQMDLRVNVLRSAYKHARQLLKEVGDGG